MKRKKINIDKIDLEKEKLKTTDSPGLISFPHHIGSVSVKPEDKGKIRGRAMLAMKDQTERQMAQLYQQMQTLVEQANQLKKRVEVSEKIYQSHMNFEPVIGHIYYLYEKKKGMSVLSMISPQEWGNSNPYKKHLATIKLLGDHTWEIIDDDLAHSS
ncbi:DUF2452 domain-containing protein [Bacteroidota bacterium]